MWKRNYNELVKLVFKNKWEASFSNSRKKESTKGCLHVNKT